MAWPGEWDEAALDDDAWGRLVQVLERPPVTLTDSLVEVAESLAATFEEAADWIEAVRSGRIAYDEYLLSDWWQQIRSERLAYAGWRCEWHDVHGRRCIATTRLDVHHLSYKRLGAEDWFDDLVVLCRYHHAAGHGRA